MKTGYGTMGGAGRFSRSMVQLLLAACMLLGGSVLCSTWAAQVAVPPAIRVGVVAFEDFDKEFDRWNHVFAQLERDTKTDLEFDLAVGTYGDLLHWMEKGFVDLAVLTPGVFSEYLRDHDDTQGSPDRPSFDYLATDALIPATSKWASVARRKEGFHFNYHSVCAVSAGSSLKTFGDVLEKARSGQLEFLFVNPLSASGRMLPEYVLQQAKVYSAEAIRYTYSHTESLRLLANPDSDRESIAFVWDDALAAAPGLASKVRKIEVPLLERYSIPHNVVVMRTDHPDRKLLGDWFADFSDDTSATRTRYVADWRERHSEVEIWHQVLSRTREDRESQPVSMDEIGQILLHSARSQPTPPRLAVVLSGGGAKCSYQVGAVCALEEKLAQLRAENPGVPLDIDLIVGTSGGAINAVPIAFGVTKTSRGREDFQDVWASLDQRDIVVPSRLVRINMGLWFALLEIAILLWFLNRFVQGPSRRVTCFYRWALGLALLHAVSAYLHYTPWEWMGHFHLLHHAWLWLSFGIPTTCWSLVLVGVICWWIQRKKQEQSESISLSRRRVTWVLTVLLLGLPLVQLVTLFCFQDTLSGGKGMQHAIAQGLPLLISRHFEGEGQPSLDLDEAEDDLNRLRLASRQLVEGGQLQRDLVITANCIEKTDESLPTDLYFFGAADKERNSPFRERGISFHDYPSLLLDIVIGSGTIFPVFPARRIADFPGAGHHVELIDGGFAHNSPVEAAVLWGATHIVLVEATPQRTLKRKNFISNAASAFVHLHRQTQLVDARSKQQVVVFTLQPSPPHMCVLDFASNLLRDSIQRGYDDAIGKGDQGDVASQFHKERGEPVFTPVRK